MDCVSVWLYKIIRWRRTTLPTSLWGYDYHLHSIAIIPALEKTWFEQIQCTLVQGQNWRFVKSSAERNYRLYSKLIGGVWLCVRAWGPAAELLLSACCAWDVRAVCLWPCLDLCERDRPDNYLDDCLHKTEPDPEPIHFTRQFGVIYTNDQT